MIISNSLCVLFAVFCLVVSTSYGFTLPKQLSKCAVGDNDCAAQRFTYIIQHSDEFPDLKIPSLEPYSPPEAWALEGTSPINYNIQTTNMRMDGFKKLTVQEISGFTSVSENAKITAKLSIPKIKIVTNFKGRVFIPVVGEVRPEAILTFDLSDAEMPVTVDGEFVESDGKSYFHLKRVSSELFVSHIKSDVSVDGGWIRKAKEKFWTAPGTALMNLNWKLIKAEMDRDKEKFNIIIKDILTPILKGIAVQDIFQM